MMHGQKNIKVGLYSLKVIKKSKWEFCLGRYVIYCISGWVMLSSDAVYTFCYKDKSRLCCSVGWRVVKGSWLWVVCRFRAVINQVGCWIVEEHIGGSLGFVSYWMGNSWGFFLGEQFIASSLNQLETFTDGKPFPFICFTRSQTVRSWRKRNTLQAFVQFFLIARENYYL